MNTSQYWQHSYSKYVLIYMFNINVYQTHRGVSYWSRLLWISCDQLRISPTNPSSSRIWLTQARSITTYMVYLNCNKLSHASPEVHYLKKGLKSKMEKFDMLKGFLCGHNYLPTVHLSIYCLTLSKDLHLNSHMQNVQYAHHSVSFLYQ